MKLLTKMKKEIKKKWDFECVTDASNWGMVNVQKGKILNKRNGLVLLEDGTKTTLKRIKNFFNDSVCGVDLWAEYNPILKKWKKIGNIKWLKK